MNLSKILCTFSGDDYGIISKLNDNKILNRFKAIGVFVTAIFALCFISCYFTFTKLFQNYFIGIPIGLFFAFLITNIYLLLLYTLSKNSLPCKSDKAAKLFSIYIRVVFICFIAIIVSKPIETIIFSVPIDDEILSYKHEQIEKYRKSTTEYFDAETNDLKKIIEKQKKIISSLETNQIDNLEELLKKKELQKEELITSMIYLVSNSNYYIQSIVILNTKYRACWFISLLTIFIFLFPAYLKYFLGEHTSYYKKKKEIETQLVIKEYEVFKKQYKELFITKIISELQYPKHYEENSNLKELENIHNYMIRNIQYSESFTDAPFNTIRKKDDREFLKENDLISDLYNA